MNERQWYSRHVKPALTNPAKRWLAIKVQNYNNPGFPDALCCFDGVACLIETKFVRKLPVRDDSLVPNATPTPEQYRHLAAWREAGGLGYVLVGCEASRTWYLFTAAQMLAYEDRGGIQRHELINEGILAGEGWLPLNAIPPMIMIQGRAA